MEASWQHVGAHVDRGQAAGPALVRLRADPLRGTWQYLVA